MTPPPTELPQGAPGDVLRARRNALNLRQEDLANEAEVSQKLISEIERGEQELTAAGLGRVVKIARALDWTLNELQEHTGLDLGIEESAPPTRPGPPIPPVVPFRETPISIPPELLQMVEKHGDAYPVLKTAQMQRMLAAPRNFGGAEVGPQTAEDWFDYWMANKRFLT